jgi:hypothetical protein
MKDKNKKKPKEIEVPDEDDEKEDNDDKITEFSFGEIHFRGKNLKPRCLIKSLLKDRAIKNYLTNFNQVKMFIKTPTYVD